jgi:hypothetical protein
MWFASFMRMSMRPLGAGAVFATACVLVSAQAAAVSIRYTIPGTAMPWVFHGINRKYKFGLGDGSAPIVVVLRDLNVHWGSVVSIRYVSGSVSADPGVYPYTEAGGDTSFLANNGTGNGFGVFPSYYMTPYPIYLCELVGAFANKNGKIVGQPFAIADGPISVTVPAHAALLQLGVNDDKFSDNAGSWVVAVSKE